MSILSPTFQALATDFGTRAQALRKDRNQHTLVLKEVEPGEVITFSLGNLLRSIERKATLVEAAVSIGRRLQQKFAWERDSVTACQLGWFVIVSFLETGLLSYELEHNNKKKQRSTRYQHYFLQIADRDRVEELWDALKTEDVDLFPTDQPTGTWTSARHSSGYSIIKKAEAETLSYFSPRKQPLVFGALNKLGNQGWVVNSLVLDTALKLYHEPLDGSPFDFSNELSRQKKFSKQIEVDYTLRLAAQNAERVFFHLYNCDFRGRIYPNTAYLHEQGSDLAKGLLLLEQPTELGKDGLFWLLVRMANTYGRGQDKLPLKQRADWAEANLERYFEVLASPSTDLRWTQAENPWAFLAVVNELYTVLNSWTGPVESFPSSLPVFIDGTVSGTQHLVALSRDEVLAPYTNLVASETPGDLYTLLADKLWERLAALESQLDQGTIKRFEEVLDTSIELQRTYMLAPRASEQKALAYATLAEWRNQNRRLREQLFAVFWNRVTNRSERRKLVKRGVMTLSYGATRFGFSQQIIDDSPGISDYIDAAERLWCAKLGELLFEVCYEELKGPASMLRLFENLAERASADERYLSWTVPVTNFKVIQRYRKPKTQRTKLSYAGQELKVCLEAWEDATLNQTAQRTGASPNIVHSLDAAHLTSVVASVDYPVAVIHDSFGCTPGNMTHLFHHVRRKFVELYKTDPLDSLLTELDALDLMPVRGSYSVESILDSQFAFS